MTAKQRRRFAVILAAGDGKRMKSQRPKVLCEVLCKPMICWVEDACHSAKVDEIYLVTGEKEDEIKKAVSSGCHFFRQNERRGTGHAVMMAEDALNGGGDVLVLYGDAPLMDAETINASYQQHIAQKNAVTLVTAQLSVPFGYGRILRNESGDVAGIVEEKDATMQQKAITEINAGTYWFNAEFLADALGKITDDNVQNEYYLTDTIQVAVSEGKRVGGFPVSDSNVILGANDRRGLKTLNEVARNREIDRHLDYGVDIPCDDGVIIGMDVEIGQDTLILPGTILLGKTKIGSNCVIGPNSYLVDSAVGDGTHVNASYMTKSSVGQNSTIGPFAQMRPNTVLGNHVKIGDFVEVKNSTIGDRTSIAHLTYIGDSDVGSQCNFGCGVVTANYDGCRKYRTVIGDRAFIGCNTNLIPPVRLGEGAYTAAGTTVDADVPPGALAIGRVRQQVKDAWASQNINFKGGKPKKK